MTVAESKSSELEDSKANATFQHILVATDFSEPSRKALCDALILASEHHAYVSVVHALPADQQSSALDSPPALDLARSNAERQMKALVRELEAEQKIDTLVVRHGPIAKVVASLIEEAAIDLLVIGTRGRGGLRKIALGSVAEELLRVVPCPVMTFGPKAEIAAIKNGPGFHRILFATDFGKGSEKAMPLALSLARAHQAELILLHMMQTLPATTGSLSAYSPSTLAADELLEWEGATRKRALQKLKDCLPVNTGLTQKVEFVVGTDLIPEGVLNAAGKYNADLIVMGANRAASPRIAAHIPWSAVHEVVRNAACPVLTVAE